MTENTKFQVESYCNYLKNSNIGMKVNEKKALLDSIDLIGKEIGFQSEKNSNLLKLIKVENEDEKIKYLNKELEDLLKENKEKKKEYNAVIPSDKITKFTIGKDL